MLPEVRAGRWRRTGPLSPGTVPSHGAARRRRRDGAGAGVAAEQREAWGHRTEATACAWLHGACPAGARGARGGVDGRGPAPLGLPPPRAGRPLSGAPCAARPLGRRPLGGKPVSSACGETEAAGAVAPRPSRPPAAVCEGTSRTASLGPDWPHPVPCGSSVLGSRPRGPTWAGHRGRFLGQALKGA